MINECWINVSKNIRLQFIRVRWNKLAGKPKDPRSIIDHCECVIVDSKISKQQTAKKQTFACLQVETGSQVATLKGSETNSKTM